MKNRKIRKIRKVTGKPRTFRDYALFIALLLLGVLMILPFIWMILVAFERGANINAPIPPRFYIKDPSLFNIKLLGKDLFIAYRNSIIAAVGSVIVDLITVLTGGYALSKGRFRGRKFITAIIAATMMIPLETRLIPMFLMFNSFGLTNSYAALILPSMVDGFGLLLAKQYFDKLPDCLRESAFLDGAGEFRIYVQIFLPLTGPIAATLAILAFINSWNNFLWPLLVVTDPDMRTIPLYISSFSMENATRTMGTTMAVAFVAIIPVVIIFLFLQKYVIRSIATSGIKGE